MSPEPFDSRAEDLPAERWEKGYGDESVWKFAREMPMNDTKKN